MNILILVGSLSEKSVNKSLAMAASALSPEGVQVTIADLSGIPFLNADLEVDGSGPKAVMTLRSQVKDADGLILVSPEYNRFISGILKNTLDWLSAEYHIDGKPLISKPVAIMTASTGGFGGVRAAQQLQTLSVILEMQIFARDMINVSKAHEKFDKETNKLVDEELQNRLQKFMVTYVDWINSLR